MPIVTQRNWGKKSKVFPEFKAQEVLRPYKRPDTTFPPYKTM